MARPSKLTAERLDRVLAGLRVGATLARACAAAGISDDTLRRWRSRRPDVRTAVERAEAEQALHCLQMIAAAAPKDWRAAAWLLERRFPEHYGRVSRKRLEHGGEVAAQVETIVISDWRAKDDTEDEGAEDARAR